MLVSELLMIFAIATSGSFADPTEIRFELQTFKAGQVDQ